MSGDLYVGDVHARPEDLDDCQNLLDFVLKTARKREVDRIVFLGDQHHTHAIIHLEVIAFWRRNVSRLTEAGFPVVLMVGNHDMSGDASSTSHAMMAYESMPNVTIVSAPRVATHAKIVYIPYIADNARFIGVCKQYPDHMVVCHAEFDGARYENGFYASTGVDPAALPQSHVISGHIHSPQEFGKIWYLGSPRSLTAGDANEDRFIYIIHHNPFGNVESKEAISTANVCQMIYQVDDDAEDPVMTWDNMNAKDKYIVDIIGPQAWIEERRPLWLGRARIRTHRTDQQIIRLRESEGIEKALVKFADTFIPPRGTSKDVLMSMVTKRLVEAS